MITWKILSLQKDEEGCITSVKYSVKAENETNSVITEGIMEFFKSAIFSPYEDVTQEQIVGWIKEKTTLNGQNSIELNLQNQLENAKTDDFVTPHWVKPTFKPTL